MKKYIIILFFVLASTSSIAQLTFELHGVTKTKISAEIPANAKVVLREIKSTPNKTYKSKAYNAYLYFDGGAKMISLNKLKNIVFTPVNSKQFWQNRALIGGVYKSITKNGLQYKLRKEIEDDAIDFLSRIKRNKSNFEDSYLENYLYSLAYKIYPNNIGDGRPGILNVKILKDLIPNAFIYQNGTMFITTGLLSTINSEEELIAILAHEISHFVLDHSIININKAEKRKKRAEFWAAFATGIAVAADIYTAKNNDYYVPGTITMGTSILAYSIAADFNARMGLKYSREQEMDADASAVALLKFLDIDHTALSSVLKKIKKHNILSGNYLALTEEGSHPALDNRIASIGIPGKFGNENYDKIISFVNSFNAIIEFNNHRLKNCENLVRRNIKSGVATEDDYILLSMVTTFMFDTVEKNLEALEYIKTAKGLNISPSINMSKQESIILIRLKRYEDAILSFKEYLDDIDNEKLRLTEVKSSREWSYINNYLSKEREWTVKMMHKVGKM